MNKALLLIDCQHDFIEGGSLAVKGAKDIMDNLTNYIKTHGQDYKIIIMTLDFHPWNHSSFNEYGGKWPMHCVQFTKGASVYESLSKAVISTVLSEPKTTTFSLLTKGTDPQIEEYSAFTNDKNIASFKYNIDKNNIDQIDIAGICGDICVLDSIKSLIDLGYKDKIHVLEDFCPSIDGGSSLHNFIVENNLNAD